MDRKAHWEHVFETKDTRTVSWYRAVPETSLELIEKYTRGDSDVILDLGAGDSNLPDFLLEKGFSNLTVADISLAALEASKLRLLEKAQKITWVESDVLDLQLEKAIDVWHDRAVFHFLSSGADQEKYVEVASNHIQKDGFLLLATFALDGGPLKCSGLEVARHNNASIQKIFGGYFKLIHSFFELHTTPSGGEQKFAWFVLKKT